MGMPRGVPSAMTPNANVAFRPGAPGNPGGAVPSARNRAGVRTIVCPPARVCFESRRLVLARPVGGLEPGREDASGGAVERLVHGQVPRAS